MAGYKTFEDFVQLAENAVNSFKLGKTEKELKKRKDWLQKLLNILKERKYATIQNIKGDKLNVQKIAHTTIYLSFFDVYHHIYWVNTEVNPIETEKLKYRLK